MASTKAGGSTRNLRDSQPKYLGVKLADGASARPGMVIVRQRGTKVMAGKNVRVGKDHTIFSLVTGRVLFAEKRKVSYDGKISRRKIVSVVPA
jgi:large subunit ribosomal protein L27